MMQITLECGACVLWLALIYIVFYGPINDSRRIPLLKSYLIISNFTRSPTKNISSIEIKNQVSIPTNSVKKEFNYSREINVYQGSVGQFFSIFSLKGGFTKNLD